MSSKRVKIREMKRRQKQYTRMWIIGGLTALVLVLVVLALYGLDLYSKSYIMTYEKQKISVNDYKYCATMVTSEENAKEQALDQLLTLLTVNKVAQKDGVTLTEDEQTEMKSYAESLKSYYESYGLDLSFITTERMTELLAMDTLYGKLQERYTADYALNENDFQQALVTYKQNEPVDYINMDLKYIFTSTSEAIENARQELEGGAEFDEVLKRYSEYYDAESEISTYPLKYMGLESDVASRILALEVGDYSEVVEMDSMYVIFGVETKTIPTDEEIETSYREKYTSEKKSEQFTEIVKGWKEQASYTLNQKAYDAA